jgi:hypothetical protein
MALSLLKLVTSSDYHLDIDAVILNFSTTFEERAHVSGLILGGRE